VNEETGLVETLSEQRADAVLRGLLAEVLGSPGFADELREDTRLLGAIPEFDSMAIAALVVGIEQACDLELNDRSLNAQVFETFGSLKAFVAEHLRSHGQHAQQVL